MALGTDALRCGKTTGKTGFLSLPTRSSITILQCPPRQALLSDLTVTT